MPAVVGVKVGPQPEPPTVPIPTFSPSQELRGILLPSLVPVRNFSPEIKPAGHTNPEFVPGRELVGILLPSLKEKGHISPEFVPGRELVGILLPSLKTADHIKPKGIINSDIKPAGNTNPEFSSDQLADTAILLPVFVGTGDKAPSVGEPHQAPGFVATDAVTTPPEFHDAFSPVYVGQ